MKKKLIILITITALFVSVFSISAYASELQISKKYVDSNSYTFVGNAARSSATYNYATVKITALYNADGTSSNYQRLRVRIGGGGESGWVLVKGTSYDLNMPTTYRPTGTIVPYFCKGNDPALDCQASGYFNSH
jgi:hypothetical protein